MIKEERMLRVNSTEWMGQEKKKDWLKLPENLKFIKLTQILEELTSKKIKLTKNQTEKLLKNRYTDKSIPKMSVVRGQDLKLLIKQKWLWNQKRNRN